jgi:hypothetical protein
MEYFNAKNLNHDAIILIKTISFEQHSRAKESLGNC